MKSTYEICKLSLLIMTLQGFKVFKGLSLRKGRKEALFYFKGSRDYHYEFLFCPGMTLCARMVS
jgi:hypothetical protein